MTNTEHSGISSIAIAFDEAIAAEARAHAEFNRAEIAAWAIGRPADHPTPWLRQAQNAQRAAVAAVDAVAAEIHALPLGSLLAVRLKARAAVHLRGSATGAALARSLTLDVIRKAA